MQVDTGILVELLRRPATDPLVQRIVQTLGDEMLFASAIQLGELADAARAKGQSVPKAVGTALDLVELVPLSPEIAVEASNLKAEARRRANAKDFSLIDGVILASARSMGQRLLTLDPEFDGFGDVTRLSP